MKFNFSKPMSRLKKKLLIYFILIAIVSISVSAEIILEVSSKKFQYSIYNNFYSQLETRIPDKQLNNLQKDIDFNTIFEPIYNLRDRMILFLLVVSGSIIGAFYMFTKDIVSPMDGIVDATKKIANGDLTVTAPVMSEDEIGQMAGLINDMNMNIQDLIFHVKQEVNRYQDKITIVSNKIAQMIYSKSIGSIIDNKRMRTSEFKEIINTNQEIIGFLEIMSNDLSSLKAYINMYKTYKIQSEISQDEIEDAMRKYAPSAS